MKNAQTKTVLLVDDHPIVRVGMAQLINQDEGLEVCGEANDAVEALQVLRERHVDIMIADVNMNGISGFDLVHTGRQRHPHLRSIVVSMYDEQSYAERAIKSGANGYIMKDDAATRIIEAIHEVLEGGTYVSEAMKQRLVDSLHRGGPVKARPEEVLSAKEFEVFRLIGQGLKKSEIAERLFRSVNTVETHRAAIKRKLSLRTSAELYRLAFQANEA